MLRIASSSDPTTAGVNSRSFKHLKTSVLASGGGAADLDRFVGLRALHQQREEAFLDALLDVLGVRGQHVRDLHALGFDEDLLRAALRAGAIAAERLRRLPMPHARMLMPGRSAISLRCSMAFGSSSISIASFVPFGFFGDHTFAFAAVKKLSASFASSISRMCGIVTPSAPASRISLTRAFVASAPSLLIGGMRTISVLRLDFLRTSP